MLQAAKKFRVFTYLLFGSGFILFYKFFVVIHFVLFNLVAKISYRKKLKGNLPEINTPNAKVSQELHQKIY